MLHHEADGWERGRRRPRGRPRGPLHPHPVPDSSRLHLPGIDPATLADISSRLAAAEASEARYRTIFDACPLPLWVFEVATARFLAVNHAASAVYGWTREEFLSGMTLHDVRPEETVEEWERHHAAIPRRGPIVRHYEGRWRHRTRAGRELWVDVVTHDLVFEGTDARLALIIDVTDRVEAERVRESERSRDALRRQSQKLEEVGLLAGGVAHDFNNLLTVILGNVEIARAMLPPDTPVREELDEILDAARRGAALTRQLLAFGRRDGIMPVLTDLHVVARDAARLLGRLVGGEVHLLLEERGGRAIVYADAGHLAQVVMNLVVNARDAMPDGGTITVRTTGDAPLPAGAPRPGPSTLPGAQSVHLDTRRGALLEVRDTGTGMPPATLARAFEPFFTTKAEGAGTGLGLATVHGIVAQAGGSVWIETAEGRGTTVRVWLPGASIL